MSLKRDLDAEKTSVQEEMFEGDVNPA